MRAKPDHRKPASPEPPSSGDPGRRWFEFFDEIGIIAQLSRAAFEAAQSDGLTLPQFTVLNHMVRLGEGRAPLDLARAFQAPKASLTNTLSGLERRGLIEARPNPKDGRGKLIYLTAAGRARREAAIDSMGPVIAALASPRPADGPDALIQPLAEIRRRLDEMRD